MVRFLHTSDWQLGMRRHFLDGDAQARFEQARIDAIRTIARVAAEQGCAFVVVAGDVFESNHLQQRTIARAIEALRSFTVPTYLLPGNHDPLDPASIFLRGDFTGACPPNIHVLTGESFSPIPGVEVHGAPWRSKRPSTGLVASVCDTLGPAPAGVLRVLVAHGAVTSFAAGRIGPGIIDEAGADAALADGRIHYLALGDRHSTLAAGDTGRAWYSGASEPTDYDEDDPGNVLVVDLEPGKCCVTPVKTGTWQFIQRHMELHGDDDLDGLERWLDGIAGKERAVLKLSFSGTLSLARHARLDTVIDDARHTFAAIEQWQRHMDLTILPGDDDLEDMGLGGYARETLETLMEATRGSGDDAETARDALALLHRFARRAS